MTTPPAKPLETPSRDPGAEPQHARRETRILLAAAAAVYAPLTLLGYGANVDSERIAEAGRTFIATGVYTPSRYPGFPVHEIPVAVLSHFGGSLLANAGTVAMALIAVHSFVRLVDFHALPHRRLLTAAFIGNPIFWTSATYTIDYVWSLALLMLGFRLLCERRPLVACTVLGLATGSRVSSLGFAGTVILYQLAVAPAGRRLLVACAPLVVVIPAMVHAPTLWRYGVLRLYFGDWDRVDYVLNTLYGNLLFLGPLAAFALVAFVPGLLRRRHSIFRTEWRPLSFACITIVAGYEVLFCTMPIQVGYLLPALPAVLLLLGIVLRDRPQAMRVWVGLSISASVLAVNLVSVTGNVYQVESSLPPLVAIEGPRLEGRTTAMTAGFFVRWGYVVADAHERLEHKGLVP